MIFRTSRKNTVCAALLFQLLLVAGCVSGPFPRPAYREVTEGVSYAHITVPKVPWSIHITRYEYARPDLKLSTTLGRRTVFGLSTLVEDIKKFPPEVGQPIAGVNGDFFIMAKQPYQGDPHDLQIMNGELVSSPGKKYAVWTDADGKPHVTKVVSKMKVTWPNGQETSIAVNEVPTNNTGALLAPLLGPTTRNTNAYELILEPLSDSPWLPLHVNETYSARVREINPKGNTPLTNNCMVLSFTKKAAARLPKVQPGAPLKISTEVSPSMKEVQNAIGGGPILVEDKKSTQHQPPGQADHMHQRNPRTAVGWNDKELFLVVVDGRKKDLSLGMTLPELGDLMASLGCTDAVNLDGGGSTTMWLDGKVVNRPSEGSLRHIGNALVLSRKPVSASSTAAHKN